MKVLDKILPTDWKKEIGNGILLTIVVAVGTKIISLFQGKTFSETIVNFWSLLKTPITIPLYSFIIVAILTSIAFKIRRLYFYSEKNIQIGDFTFKELYSIMKDEYPKEITYTMKNENIEPEGSLFENYLRYYPRAVAGVITCNKAWVGSRMFTLLGEELANLNGLKSC